MYCRGIIKPCDRPCGFVEPVFQDDNDDDKFFLCTTTPDGTIASFVPFDGSYPIETNEIEKHAPYNVYRVEDPAPLAFIFYKGTTPTLVLGSRTRVLYFLAQMITCDKAEMPLEARFKAAQFLGEKYLLPQQIQSIYYEYYVHLSKHNSQYAEMWKEKVKSSEKIDIRCPAVAKKDENIASKVAAAIYEILIPASHTVGIAYSAKSNTKGKASKRSDRLVLRKEIIKQLSKSMVVLPNNSEKNVELFLSSTHKLLAAQHFSKKVIGVKRKMVKSVVYTTPLVLPNQASKVYLAKKKELTEPVVAGDRIDIVTSLESREKTTIVVID